MKQHRSFLRASILVLAISAGAQSPLADVVSDCASGSPVRVMQGCSIVIEGGAPAPMNLADAYAYRANASEMVGNHSDALADLDKAIQLNPNQAGLYNNRGNVYLAAGNEAEALANYGDAIRRDPNFSGAYFNRGNAYARIGDLTLALRDLTAAVHLGPAFAPAYYNRAIVNLRLGRPREATADIRQTLKLNPRHQGALEAMSKLGISTGMR
ncbi:tetratricopeptide repeat protein [Hyphomicrobium sp.]|uniref:tetratricopeptide repeat protein n=1 Tax=Hyphomicrobium sp. TaxID=82 RepID=UPI000FB1A961|nr:tetratricopeptide repeat protein [Hyphomicrobium sp.]RUO98589.1 MAG: tetratricopeptide repeat protein [Hyphomicrobium sp.]